METKTGEELETYVQKKDISESEIFAYRFNCLAIVTFYSVLLHAERGNYYE